MSRKFLITGGLVVLIAVVVLVALGVWVVSFFTGKSSGEVASPYSVVYLADGEIYFGKLSWFPKPHITGPWTIQRTMDKNNQPQVSVVQVNKSLWSPVDEIYLNEKSIMAWSALRADGQMAKLLENPEAAQQQAQQQQQAPGASGNFRGPSTPPPASK